jgi:hypothetical protein
LQEATECVRTIYNAVTTGAALMEHANPSH